MPITSKYSTKQVEKIIDEVFDVLEKNQVSPELALMIVGDVATNVINSNVPAGQRQAIAEKFALALQSTIKKD
ncbi:TPA: DUF1414 domain-containing protein [Photobacterium damselae]|uniref:UPF0352 protein VDA_001596 n=5 Tax=Photobacterium damselae TaxID=38293 RepID=D0YVM7_PHODD|nr:DUF1414 domain-containing protein [Photobacterium damselae]ARR49769.1 hypothetical protein CAY62_09420 [Photobacterium damselae subsp. damselae]AWK81396.1 hypothetical protein BST98_04640 [Photobacterium damselae]EEZ40569.1 hypothetical protein VDA_001596 [Photobacterium damselae subsp. damselae CIP 102761]EHA1081213.1 DUF1414 domain-containing protein [Photobacterium damselae]EJN6959936.1 DUF1414 domain-containing protein [Photobacterium damselae]